MTAGPPGPPSAPRRPGDAADAWIVVDALTPDDAAACARLEAELFPADDPWTASAFRAELHAGYPYLAARWVGPRESEGPRARSWATPGSRCCPRRAFSREPAEAEVHTIGVAPPCRATAWAAGCSPGLLARADALGAVTFLEVRTDNGPALALYRSEGFEVVGTRRRYYASGADAYTMRRETARPSLMDWHSQG